MTYGRGGWRAVVQWVVSLVLALLISTSAVGQKQASAPAVPGSAQTAEQVAASREQLIELLRMSPKLATLVAHDPTLIGETQYIGRNNPRLAEFLQGHPEIAKNPEFYLYANIAPGGRSGSPASRLEAEVWPELNSPRDSWKGFVANDLLPFTIFVIVFSALLWLLRTLIEHRRWTRTFNTQTEIYNKLLDKFASNEDLSAYVQSEAGKRFLASATLPQVHETRGVSPISRVLIPLQAGVVMTMAGFGFLYLHTHVGGSTPLLGLGTLAVALGVGFMLSAGIAWALAERFGILPTGAAGTDSGANL